MKILETTIMNKIQELENKVEEIWLNDTETSTISIHALCDIVMNGLDECEKDEYCMWREYAPNGYCRCVRSVLPSQEAHTLYEELRTLALKIELARALTTLCD